MANPYTCINEAGITLPAVCVNWSKIQRKQTLTGLTCSRAYNTDYYQCCVTYYECEYGGEGEQGANTCYYTTFHKRRVVRKQLASDRADYISTFWGRVSDLRRENGTVPSSSFIGILGVVCNAAPLQQGVRDCHWQSCVCTNLTCSRNDYGWCTKVYRGCIPTCCTKCYPSDACTDKCTLWYDYYSASVSGSTSPSTLGTLVIGLGDGTFVLDGVWN